MTHASPNLLNALRERRRRAIVRALHYGRSASVVAPEERAQALDDITLITDALCALDPYERHIVTGSRLAEEGRQ